MFWHFHTFVCIANQVWTAVEIVHEKKKKKKQGNVWEVQNTTGRFLAQLHPSKFFLKILFLVPKVFNSWIFQKRCFMKIIWHRISKQTLLFQDVFAYPSVNVWDGYNPNVTCFWSRCKTSVKHLKAIRKVGTVWTKGPAEQIFVI